MRSLKPVKFVLLLLAVVFTSATFAAVPWFANGPKREVQTLVITGNYKSPRLLAELIQYESRQPYLLLPPQDSGDTRIIFCPPKSNSLQIREDKFNDFVRFLNPRRIIVLGNDAYVQPKYIAMLDRTIPVIRVDSVDWNRSAEELTDLLHLSNLDRNYRKLRETMLDKGKIYRPISKPKQQMLAKEVMEEQAPEDFAVEAAPAADDVVEAAPVEEVPAEK